MNPADLISMAEMRLADAEGNLASCVAALKTHKEKFGGVPNPEVIALVQAQAMVAQAGASLALAKSMIETAAAPSPAPCDHAPDGGNHPDGAA